MRESDIYSIINVNDNTDQLLTLKIKFRDSLKIDYFNNLLIKYYLGVPMSLTDTVNFNLHIISLLGHDRDSFLMSEVKEKAMKLYFDLINYEMVKFGIRAYTIDEDGYEHYKDLPEIDLRYADWIKHVKEHFIDKAIPPQELDNDLDNDYN